MASVCFLLYFFIFLKSPSPTFAETDPCTSYNLIVFSTADLQPALTTESEGVNFYYQESYYYPSVNFYYYPPNSEGFKGVSLDIEWLNTSSNSVTTRYFQGHEHCFDDRWGWRVVMGCDYDKKHQTIRCSMRVGDCHWHCYMNYPTLLDKPWARLYWTAHGPSRWTSFQPSEYCQRRYSRVPPPRGDYSSTVPPSPKDYSCTDSFSSPPSSTTNARHPLSPLSVVVMVLLIVLYCWW